MNPAELKNHLSNLAREHGENILTRDELDYLNGRITYNTYLDRCYADYLKGKLTKKKRSRKN